MTRRIFRSILLVALSVFIACIVFIFDILYTYYGQEQDKQLKAQLQLAVNGVEASGINYLNNVSATGNRLTWVSSNGVVLFDSQTNINNMDNHKDREEIKAAYEKGSGYSSRYSTTFTEELKYYATRLEDGSVLRISDTRFTVLALIMSMMQPFIVILIIAMVLAFILARSLSRRIVKPLETLNLEAPLENDTYEELTPILRRIESQHKQIREQLDRLNTARNEFETITRSMREGLVLLNASGEIISINDSAKALFHADNIEPGTSFLLINRVPEINDAMRTALKDGHAETEYTCNGRLYQIELNRIESDKSPMGVVLIAFDITEKAQAEKMRSEFTANVSHELKTPLQSIMGSAELMESGMVKDEDVPHFLSRIRSESSRLVALIDDIIRLSQLEESRELTFEELSLSDIAGETVLQLKPIAESRNITMELNGDNAVMVGVPSLLHEIVYNLCDNAIKYNKEGGRVDVNVAVGKDKVCLDVSDTGIGIPLEHQSRIFERFYRVDKSRSRESGGTGLGLSIVKHAVQIHNGTISLNSKMGVGTNIHIEFKV